MTVFAGACSAAKDGFTLHAATCAGAEDDGGRERLLRYVLRPAVAQERIQKTEQGLVRITLKKPWSDGTVAVELDPLSLLCRLAASVPPPKLHTVRYSGVLGSASRLRSRVVPNAADHVRSEGRGGGRRRVQAEESLPAVGGAHDADAEARRARVSPMPGPPHAPRAGHGPRRGAEVRAQAGRSERAPATHGRERSALLAIPRAPKARGRRRLTLERRRPRRRPWFVLSRKMPENASRAHLVEAPEPPPRVRGRQSDRPMRRAASDRMGLSFT